MYISLPFCGMLCSLYSALKAFTVEQKIVHCMYTIFSHSALLPILEENDHCATPY